MAIRVRGLVGLAAVLGFVSACGGPDQSIAAAVPGPDYSHSPGEQRQTSSVVRTRDNANFVESERLTVSGSRNETGRCILTRQYSADEGSGINGERIIEFDRKQCTFIVARGRWTKLPHRDMERGEISSSKQNSRAGNGLGLFPTTEGESDLDSPEADESTESRAIMSMRSGGEVWQQIWYEDPINLNTSEDRLAIEWESGSGCAMDSADLTHTLYWLTASGWSKQSEGDQFDTHTCTRVTAVAYSVFRNDTFCFWDPPTWNSYFLNKVTAKSSGSPEFAYSFDADGGCSDWLHPNVAFDVSTA